MIHKKVMYKQVMYVNILYNIEYQMNKILK